MKHSVAYKSYSPVKNAWELYNKKLGKTVSMNNFDIVMMKSTKKFKPFYFTDSQLDDLMKKHDDLHSLRVSNIKNQAYQYLKERATKKEIDHPFSNNALFIDCLLNYNTEQYSDTVSYLDAPDIQTISKAVTRIFHYYDLTRRVDPIINQLADKKISFKDARYKIEQVISGRAIRYIPFGSPLQKALTKAFKHTGYGYQGVIGGCDNNMFGFFYMENENHNIIKDILEKESD